MFLKTKLPSRAVAAREAAKDRIDKAMHQLGGAAYQAIAGQLQPEVFEEAVEIETKQRGSGIKKILACKSRGDVG